MKDTWPSNHPKMQPTYLAIDLGFKVMQTLVSDRKLLSSGGWIPMISVKVYTFHLIAMGSMNCV